MRNLTTTALALLLASLASCNDDDNDDDGGPSGNALVQDMVDNNTANSAEPVEINDLDLQFSEDENAYSGLFD